ncbi:epididymal secretory glutathione peroxidase isoform X2 [Hippopotamus amphibius kiboko]|uniref:epididymal secretory glutathione peroxidase isoform X2 n=1 Tax=Hippopotamus amphibius kiboko TaxID=575201 RepID=UPI002593A473|nr:epididymal secretory glutathione peroxidase isoform X2 [Hippopotamus amphibius kiboko]
MTVQLRASYLFPLFLAGFVQSNSKLLKMDCYKDAKGTIYDYDAFTLNGKEHIQFKQYAGKHVLFVNVATYCGLTAQYPGMFVQEEDMYLISSFLRKGM